MRKIVSNGQTMTEDGDFYIVVMKKDQDTIELFREKIEDPSIYPGHVDSVARTNFVNKLLVDRQEEPLTETEIEYMLNPMKFEYQ